MSARRVLVVDDETAIVDGVTALLDFESIENRGALDRSAALAVLEDAFFPVVITDLCLHSTEEGLALIDDIRRMSPRTQVVVLSAYITREMEDDLMRRGVSMALQKPAPMETLINAVSELLARIEEEADAVEELDLEKLYLTVRRKLYDIPRRRFGLSHERAEDVVQEAWLLFLQKRGYIRTAGAWLAGAVANLSRQQIDQKVRKRETFETDEFFDLCIATSSGDPSDVLAVRQALDQVDEKSRAMCALIGIEGMSYEEFSATTGMPIGSVGPLYIRAKKKLKKVLGH